MGNTSSLQQLPYHIQKLPVELLTEIICKACEDYKIDVRNSVHGGGIPDKDLFLIRHERKLVMITPGVLCQVSRAWRDFVCSIPALWDTVIFRAPVALPGKMRASEYWDQPLTDMKNWLRRARDCPLTVKIETSKHSFIDCQILLINELLAHSNQWKHIDIPCPGCDLLTEQYSTLQNIMKRPPVTLRGFTCRPSVHCLKASNQHPPLRIPETKLITEITKYNDFPLTISPTYIKACTLIGCADVKVIEELKHMNYLKECSIVMPFDKFNQPWLPSPPKMSTQLLPFTFVQRLSLYNMTNPVVEYMLPSLELPGLRHLAYYHQEDCAAEPPIRENSIVGSILLLLQRSNSPDLQTLDLEVRIRYGGDFDESELLEIFRIVPNLKHFKFILRGWKKTKMPKINRPTVKSAYVPLSSLTTYYVDLRELPFTGDKALLHCLNLPALKEFQVILPTNRTPSYLFADLEDLVRRSYCRLKVLKINTSITIPKKPLWNLLKALPSLECLHIIGQYALGSPHTKEFALTNSLFQILFVEVDSETVEAYLPNLSELSLEGRLASGFSWDCALDVLEYRWKGDESKNVKKLGRARIFSDYLWNPQDNTEPQQRVTALQHQGMDLKFERPDWPIDWNGIRY